MTFEVNIIVLNVGVLVCVYVFLIIISNYDFLLNKSVSNPWAPF